MVSIFLEHCILFGVHVRLVRTDAKSAGYYNFKNDFSITRCNYISTILMLSCTLTFVWAPRREIILKWNCNPNNDRPNFVSVLTLLRCTQDNIGDVPPKRSIVEFYKTAAALLRCNVCWIKTEKGSISSANKKTSRDPGGFFSTTQKWSCAKNNHIPLRT